jgi:hypothetical protein
MYSTPADTVPPGGSRCAFPSGLVRPRCHVRLRYPCCHRSRSVASSWRSGSAGAPAEPASQPSMPASRRRRTGSGAALPRTADQRPVRPAPRRPGPAARARRRTGPAGRSGTAAGRRRPARPAPRPSRSWRTGTRSSAPATPSATLLAGRPRARPLARPAAAPSRGPRPSGPRGRAGRRAAPRRTADRAGATQLAGVRHRQQAGVTGDPERLGELLGGPLVSSFDRPNPTTPGRPGRCRRSGGPPGRASPRRPGAGSGWRPPPAPCRHPWPARRRHRVEDDLHRGLQAAEPGGVRRRVDLHLDPAGAGGPLVLGDLAHQPAHLVRAADHLARGVVQPLEAGPAAAGGDVEPGAGRVEQLDRQPAALLGGELDQRRRPHRARQVQVQVRLGELHEVPHCPCCAVCPHTCIVSYAPQGRRSATLGPP